MSSVFTKIIRGEIPCYKIYEDEKTLAFLDISPEVSGHTLVVPKVEVDRIYDLEDEDYRALMATVKKLARHYEDVTGKRTILKVIGVDVPHVHVHLLPFDPESLEANGAAKKHLDLSEAEMREIQEKLKLD